MTKSRNSRWHVIALVALLWAAPAMAADLPVLFIHGFCSSADTWNETIPQLSTSRYGDDVPRVYEGATGKAAVRDTLSPGSRTFRSSLALSATSTRNEGPP